MQIHEFLRVVARIYRNRAGPTQPIQHIKQLQEIAEKLGWKVHQATRDDSIYLYCNYIEGDIRNGDAVLPPVMLTMTIKVQGWSNSGAAFPQWKLRVYIHLGTALIVELFGAPTLPIRVEACHVAPNSLQPYRCLKKFIEELQRHNPGMLDPQSGSRLARALGLTPPLRGQDESRSA